MYWAPASGSYVSTSLVFNEIPTLSDPVFGNNALGIAGWQLEESIFEPGPSGEHTKTFITDLMYDLGAKRKAGDFPVTFCDTWSGAVSIYVLQRVAFEETDNTLTDPALVSFSASHYT